MCWETQGSGNRLSQSMEAAQTMRIHQWKRKISQFGIWVLVYWGAYVIWNSCHCSRMFGKEPWLLASQLWDLDWERLVQSDSTLPSTPRPPASLPTPLLFPTPLHSTAPWALTDIFHGRWPQWCSLSWLPNGFSQGQSTGRDRLALDGLKGVEEAHQQIMQQTVVFQIFLLSFSWKKTFRFFERSSAIIEQTKSRDCYSSGRHVWLL